MARKEAEAKAKATVFVAPPAPKLIGGAVEAEVELQNQEGSDKIEQ